jgi:hypothetical protein|uniref:hypothetical protein n=1 Tax=Prosthecobacter sp. TaxID=1965333 RepID=UPI00378305BD
MKKTIFGILVLGTMLCENASGQGAPPPGYGVMGVPPPGYGATPPPTTTVPAYPNSLPPPSITPGVTAPLPYADPYATAPMPGALSSYAPQGAGGYNTPPPGTAGYGSPQGPSIINYDSMEVFYRYVDPKNKSLDGAHTIGGALTVALFNPLYLKVGASWGSGPSAATAAGVRNADYDFATVQAGAGFHTTLINDRLTFVGEAGMIYANIKADNTNLGFSEGSIYVRPALRFTPFDFMEVQAGVTVSSADKYDSKVLDLSTYFRVLPMFDIGLGADFGDTTRAFRTSLRLRW